MKYKLTDETKEINGHILNRIRALRDFGYVKAGDIGGFVEIERNLSQDGDCWIYNNARVFGNAEISGNAWVFDNAEISDYARVSGDEDYMVFKNSWSSGRYFTYTHSNKMWAVGCFYGTGEELIAKAYKDSQLSGRCYEAVVKLQRELDRIMDEEKANEKGKAE